HHNTGGLPADRGERQSTACTCGAGRAPRLLGRRGLLVARACGAQCAPPRAAARGAHGNSGSGGLSTTLTLAMRLDDPVRGMAGAAASERRHFRTFFAAAVSQHRCSDVSSPTRLAPQSKCPVVNSVSVKSVT